MSMKHICSEKSRSSLTAVQSGDPQPNACDLRLGQIFHIRNKLFTICEEFKKHRGSEVLKPVDGWYVLPPDHYEVVMENEIEVAEGEAGFVITRSSLNRNGVFLTSGLYDSGFCGKMAACMHVTIGPLKIKQGTRIGQYLSFDAETLHMYDGSYGLDSSGKPKEEEKKYYE